MQVSASVNYHVHKDKAQAFEFDVDGIIGNLISPELVTTPIEVRDLRDQAFVPGFDADGIVFVNQASLVQDFEHSQDWQATYDDELQQLLKSKIGAKDVIVFDHTVRIDDPNAARRPARRIADLYRRRRSR